MTTVIEPGFSEPSVANMIELMRTNSTRTVEVQVRDVNGDMVDISSSGVTGGALDLEITDLAGTSILTQEYLPTPSTPCRITHVTTGKYSIEITPTDITDVGTYLFNWHAQVNSTSDHVYRTQVLQIVSPRILSLLPYFRLLIDKSVKCCLPESAAYLGYADSQLMMYLRQGLAYINAQPPYPVWTDIEYFPVESFSDSLLRAALYIGITSQSLFAIDTDIPSYSDQGHSFVLTHFQPLNTMATQLRAELDKVIPQLKWKFVRSGTASVETRLGYMWYNLIASSPSGSLFKNYYYNV